MSQAPTPSETTLGFAPPMVRQFSVFLDNRVGKLHDLIRTFESSPARICAFCVHDASDHAVIRLITSDAKTAKQLLARHTLPFAEVDLLVVGLTKTHSLEKMCLHLLAAELNIRFSYPLLTTLDGLPAVALAIDDATLAGQILRRKEFRLFGESELAPCSQD